MRTNQAPRGNEIESTKKKRFFPICLAGSRPTTLLRAETELIWLKETKPACLNHIPYENCHGNPASVLSCPNHIHTNTCVCSLFCFVLFLVFFVCCLFFFVF